MANPIIKIDDGQMGGYETQKTDWVPLPAGCGGLQLLVLLKAAQGNSAFSAWLEGSAEGKSAASMHHALQLSPGSRAHAVVSVTEPTHRLVRGCVESRGDPQALFQFSFTVYPGTSLS